MADRLTTDNVAPMSSMFIRNLAAFTEALGVQNAPTVWHLSMVPWPDDDKRDTFIRQLTNQNMRERLTYGG